MNRLDDLTLNHIIRTAQPNTNAPAPPLVPWEPGESCPRCRGAGYYLFDVDVQHPMFGKLQTCECLQQRQTERRRSELREKSGLASFAGKTFDTFDPQVAGVAYAFGAARGFAHTYEGFLTLVGNTGSGKTHLAQAIGNHLQAAGVEVIWATAPDALRLLRSTFNQGSTQTFDDQFELFLKAHVLVLDDLGAENPTDWGKETLFQLINERYEYQRPTVITSNLHPATPEAVKRFGQRLCSRLQDCVQGQLIVIQAADYRQVDPMQRRSA